MTRLVVNVLNENSDTTIAEPWWDTAWTNLASVLDHLEESLSRYYYAVFVCFPDDQLDHRDEKFYQTRDNVVFEFGLFLSTLGRKRTFLIVPEFPPGKIKFRIPSDLGDSITVQRYQVNKSPQAALQVDLESVRNAAVKIADQIRQHEAEIEHGQRVQEHSEAMFYSMLKLAEGEILNPRLDDWERIALFRQKIADLIMWKSFGTGRSSSDSVSDLFLYLNNIDDLLDIRQLAKRQKFSDNNCVEEVLVFADKPLEFTSDIDYEVEKQISVLRSTIVHNLNSGVKYVYFVDYNFDVGTIANILRRLAPPASWNDLITVVKVDNKLFKTYFTVHTLRDKGQEVYMSALMPRRKDLLIKVSNYHVERIMSLILKLRGIQKRNEGIMTIDFH